MNRPEVSVWDQNRTRQHSQNDCYLILHPLSGVVVKQGIYTSPETSRKIR